MNDSMTRIRYLAVLFFLAAALLSCSGERSIRLDPESQDFYEHARLIMSDAESDIFKHLPDAAARREFIAEFWAKRDPDPETEENEFKEEFFDRIEYANERFQEGADGWKTDRGRIWIFFGRPDKTEEFDTDRPDAPQHNRPVSDRIMRILRWTYYRYGFAVDFFDRRGDHTYKLDPYLGLHGSYFDALEMAKFGLIQTEAGDEIRYLDLDLKFDKESSEFVVAIPAKKISFVEEDDALKADFDLFFSLYLKKGGRSDAFTVTKSLSYSEEELLDLEKLTFTVPYDLKPGHYYVDVVVTVRPDIGRTRKIFEIKR